MLHNKSQQFITPGMADGQQSSIFQDAEAQLESNGLGWSRTGTTSKQVSDITVQSGGKSSNIFQMFKGFSHKIKSKAAKY